MIPGDHLEKEWLFPNFPLSVKIRSGDIHMMCISTLAGKGAKFNGRRQKEKRRIRR
jgi:hypothetical protein